MAAQWAPGWVSDTIQGLAGSPEGTKWPSCGLLRLRSLRPAVIYQKENLIHSEFSKSLF